MLGSVAGWSAGGRAGVRRGRRPATGVGTSRSGVPALNFIKIQGNIDVTRGNLVIHDIIQIGSVDPGKR
jgi:hypothetical protein